MIHPGIMMGSPQNFEDARNELWVYLTCFGTIVTVMGLRWFVIRGSTWPVLVAKVWQGRSGGDPSWEKVWSGCGCHSTSGFPPTISTTRHSFRQVLPWFWSHFAITLTRTSETFHIGNFCKAIPTSFTNNWVKDAKWPKHEWKTHYFANSTFFTEWLLSVKCF